MRKVIIELRGEKYLVICREDRLVEFKKGEEDKLVEFTMNYLGESRIKAEK